MAIRHSAQSPSDYLLLCVRIPKSGSTNLDAAVRLALPGRRSFYLPNTVDLDGRVSSFQRFRLHRGQMRNLLAHYRSPRLAGAFPGQPHIGPYEPDMEVVAECRQRAVELRAQVFHFQKLSHVRRLWGAR